MATQESETDIHTKERGAGVPNKVARMIGSTLGVLASQDRTRSRLAAHPAAAHDRRQVSEDPQAAAARSAAAQSE